MVLDTKDRIQPVQRGTGTGFRPASPGGHGRNVLQPEPLICLTCEGTSLLICKRVSPLSPGVNQVEMGLFQAFIHSLIQFPRIQGQEG